MANHHNLVHVVSIVHNISNQVFDVNTNIWSLFHLSRTFFFIIKKHNLTLMLIRSLTLKMLLLFNIKFHY